MPVFRSAIYQNRSRISYINKHLLLLLCAMLCTGRIQQLRAQPGGGGGLLIRNICNDQLQLICDSKDSVNIRAFILDEQGCIYQEYFLQNGIHPTCSVNLSPDRLTRNLPFRNQRLCIIHSDDTMIVDFIGIITPNPVGIRDIVDSLVIQKGHFKYILHQPATPNSEYEENEKCISLVRRRITNSTINLLSEAGYLSYTPETDLSFLSPEKLPVSFYLKRARHYIQNGKNKSALADIMKGIEKGADTTDCEVLYLLCDAYSAAEQYDKALSFILQAMHCKRNEWNNESQALSENYKTRIWLYTKMNRMNDAKNDFDSLYYTSDFKIYANEERAGFKIDYLGDYKAAMDDLKITVDQIPNNHMHDRLEGSSEFASTYFVFAKAAYLNNEKQKAYKLWLKSMEFYSSGTGNMERIVFFDSLLKSNPGVPELHLSLALAYYHHGPYLGWGNETKACFTNAIEEINKAENLGMNDFRINLYRAKALILLKQYQQALKEINLAISKNNTDPRCYYIRFEIKNKLGRVDSKQEDKDWQIFQSLSGEWVWEKY